MLPRVVDNSYDFGHVDKSILGHEIKIGCMVRLHGKHFVIKIIKIEIWI